MQNPWKDLPKTKPFVLPKDKEAILSFNQKFNLEHHINLDSLPDPFIGNVKKAKIILLQLNPGSDFPPGFNFPNEQYEEQIFPKLYKDKIKNFNQEFLEYPFYHLNPKYRLIGGFRYWTKILKVFLKKESDYKNIANKICCIQYFPYHSQKYKALPKNIILESQKFNFEMIKNAMTKNKLIIIMRAKKYWLNNKFINTFKNSKYYTLNSPQNPVLTENNFKDKNGFEELKKILY